MLRHATGSLTRLLKWQSFKLKIKASVKASCELFLLRMHVPFSAVVRGYLLRCCIMGADKQLKTHKPTHTHTRARARKKQKSSKSFHKECGGWMHLCLVITSVCDPKPRWTRLLLLWVTIQKYTKWPFFRSKCIYHNTSQTVCSCGVIFPSK